MFWFYFLYIKNKETERFLIQQWLHWGRSSSAVRSNYSCFKHVFCMKSASIAKKDTKCNSWSSPVLLNFIPAALRQTRTMFVFAEANTKAFTHTDVHKFCIRLHSAEVTASQPAFIYSDFLGTLSDRMSGSAGRLLPPSASGSHAVQMWLGGCGPVDPH